jgi:hypothetical protein
MMLVSGTAFATTPGDDAAAAAGSTSHLAAGGMTYDLFERAVLHEDLDVCPVEFDPQEVFCRLTLAGGMAHVFVFAFDGDQPLLAVKSYALTEAVLKF